jgi:hypothetical protein
MKTPPPIYGRMRFMNVAREAEGRKPAQPSIPYRDPRLSFPLTEIPIARS